MRATLIAFAFLLTCMAMSVWAADPAPTTAPVAPTVSRLLIQKETANDLNVNLTGPGRVQLVVILSQPDQTILGVDEAESKLLSAADDKGTDLTERAANLFSFGDLNAVCKIADDQHSIAIPISLPGLPSPGATTMQIKGDIVLQCGSDETTEEIKPFDLTKGTSAQFGTHTLKVWVGGLMGNLSPRYQGVYMELNERGTWLESFQLIDEADHVIDSTPRGTRGKNDRILIVDGRVKTAGLRITYFRTSAQVHQPIDMKVSVGLP